MEGDRDALTSAGLPTDDKLIVGCHSAIGAAVEAGFHLLDLRPARPPCSEPTTS